MKVTDLPVDCISQSPVDLHVHSSASDGSFSVEELVDLAVENGLKILAITDHDTLDATKRAVEYAITKDLRIISGLEISCNSSFGPVHILGYGLQNSTPILESLLTKIQAGRRDRNPQIIQKLQTLGFNITLQQVRSYAGGDIIGRPHIARALIENEYVENSDEAFNRFLRHGGIAYVSRYRPSIKEAINALKKSNAISVLAHPGLIDVPNLHVFRNFLAQMAKMGLDGIEVHYKSHDEQQFEIFSNLAEEFGLLMTGGSDFHGLNKMDNRLGYGCCGRPITAEFVADFLDRLANVSL